MIAKSLIVKTIAIASKVSAFAVSGFLVKIVRCFSPETIQVNTTELLIVQTEVLLTHSILRQMLKFQID